MPQPEHQQPGSAVNASGQYGGGGIAALPDYHRVQLAGRGAYGSVWVARDRTGVLVAVKVLDLGRLPEHDAGEREERALALVRQRVPHHPHLVNIFHVSRQDGRLLYAMELADSAADAAPPGQPGYRPDTLASRIATCGRLSVQVAIGVAVDLLSALEALHAAGLVHRDVKPHNVIFVNGVPKLADVGLAAAVHTELSLAGTPGYLPLDGSTGPDADLYALGKLLYQAVTGLQPADFPTLPAPLLTSPEARQIRRLNRVLLRACAPGKRDRFGSAEDMRQALEAVLQPRPARRRVRGFALAVVLAFGLACWWCLAGKEPTQEASSQQESPSAPAPGPVFFRPGDDNRAAQAEMARQLGRPVMQVNTIGMKLRLIPPGQFQMGSPEDEEFHAGDEFLHTVHIRRPFFLGMYEVTQQEYEQVAGHNPSRFRGPRLPVEQVSWDDAVAFCKTLSRKEGQTYRLPTEAEWEYACRAGTTTRTCFGRSVRLDQANIRGGQPLPVGLFAANPFGLHDMCGNVWEWCHDWYAEDYYRRSPLADPQGPARGKVRMLRGAGWFDGPGTRERDDRRLRAAFRGGREPPNTRSNRFGFRVLREIELAALPSQ